MEHRGYVGVVQYDDTDRIFHGRVAAIQDVVSFEGQSVEALEAAFRAAVDDYLAFCEAQNRAPATPFSGRFVLRTTPDVHRAATQAAASEGKSLNAWAADAIARAAGVTTV